MAVIVGDPAANNFLEGTPDNDTITGGAIEDTLLGYEGDDSLFGGAGNDVLVGGAGNDVLDGGAGLDVAIYADAVSLDGITGVTVDLSKGQASGADLGSDTLISIEGVLGSSYNDVLIGDANSNVLVGLGGSDVLKGGGGDDTLAGGDGLDNLDADTFQFSFARTAGTKTETFTGWLADQGLPTTGWTEKFFHTQYKAFLVHLADAYDLGARVKAAIHLNNPLSSLKGVKELLSMFGDIQSAVVKHGKHTHKEWFANSFTIGGGEPSVKSGDGHDTITDFAWGVDKLEFAGLAGMTRADFQAKFDVTEKDVNADGVMDDTVVALADGTWSVTLVGVTGHTEAQTYDQVSFVA